MGRNLLSGLVDLALLAALSAALSASQIGPALALELTLPGSAEKTAEHSEARGSLRLAIGPFAQGRLPTQQVDGRLSITAFRFGLAGQSTLDVMQALQDQIAASGYAPVFSCETDSCGGYDFRYEIKVLPEPDMHVNLGDFRYLVAKGATGSFVSLLVSQSAGLGFVQITELGAAVLGSANAAKDAPVQPPLAAQDTGDQATPRQEISGLVGVLESGRAAVLEDLVFASGSATLVASDYASLAALSAWLQADPTRKVVLVGHTDASGGLEGNIKLSRLRAESVQQVLRTSYKISADQLAAEGIGYLSPRASNATEAGRQTNRRVEVMVTSTDLLAP